MSSESRISTPTPQKSHRVIVKLLTGVELAVSAKANWRVSDLKSTIEDKLGITVASQELVFRGKRLPNNQTLKAARISSGSKLVLFRNRRKAVTSTKLGRFGVSKGLRLPEPQIRRHLESRRRIPPSVYFEVASEEKRRRNIQSSVDSEKLESLGAMGFGPDASQRALLRTGNDLQLALHWLLEHGSDPSANQPISDDDEEDDDEDRNRLSAILNKSPARIRRDVRPVTPPDELLAPSGLARMMASFSGLTQLRGDNEERGNLQFSFFE